MTDHTRPDILQNMRVASPCQEPWDSMRGDDKVRHCDRCQLSVYNLSAMTEHEAASLVEKGDGRMCVRFYQRADGTVLTQDCPVGLAARTGRFLRGIAAGILAGIGLLGSCSSHQERDATTQEQESKIDVQRVRDQLIAAGECEDIVLQGKILVEGLEPPTRKTDTDKR